MICRIAIGRAAGTNISRASRRRCCCGILKFVTIKINLRSSSRRGIRCRRICMNAIFVIPVHGHRITVLIQRQCIPVAVIEDDAIHTAPSGHPCLDTGHADLETLHSVAQALTKIPFIANGDIRTVQDAKQRIEEVGADAVMIGRAAMGNPYLFQQINHYFETGEILPDLSFEDKMHIAYDHLKRLIDLKGEHIAVREFRGLAPHYLRGTAGAAKLRGAISQANSLAEIEELLQI